MLGDKACHIGVNLAPNPSAPRKGRTISSAVSNYAHARYGGRQVAPDPGQGCFACFYASYGARGFCGVWRRREEGMPILSPRDITVSGDVQPYSRGFFPIAREKPGIHLYSAIALRFLQCITISASGSGIDGVSPVLNEYTQPNVPKGITI